MTTDPVCHAGTQHSDSLEGPAPEQIAEAEAIARSICPSAPLDLGIARAVHLLIEHAGPLGVLPFESCDASPGHCYHEPTIRFYGGKAAGWHALAVCHDYGLRVRDIKRVWQVEDGEPSGPFWELIMRPSVTEGLVTPPPAEYWRNA